MNYKKVIQILLLVSFTSLLSGVILGLSEKIGICSVSDWKCIDKVSAIAEPLFIISISFAAILVLLFFIPEKFFRAWQRFAIVYLPLSILLIILAPSLSRDPLLNIDKEYVTWATSISFFIISLGIILFQAIKYKQGKGVKK